jgi:hypothetical protein
MGGRNTQANGGGTSVALNTSYPYLTEGNTVYYAQWLADSCPVGQRAVAAQTYNISYSGGPYMFTASQDGVYQIEVWGAQGGNNLVGANQSTVFSGGKGGYTRGNVYLSAGQQLFVYVGGMPTSYVGGYNGGASVKNTEYTSQFGAAGGGASDVRLVSGAWDATASLNSRIIVAGGGGGAGSRGL